MRIPLVNQNGIFILESNNVVVAADAVTITFNDQVFRNVPTRGLLLVDIQQAIPSGTTTTLPVMFSMNGANTNVTKLGNTNITVADLGGQGIYLMYYDRIKNILQLL